MEEEEEPVQTKGISGRTQQKREDLHTRLSRNRGGGQPLPEAGRSFMERRFGADFRGVRVHTDSNAVQMNRELNAQAFTYGRDIYFGAGRYNPGTSAEKRLLAHELTHTIQQRNIPDKVKTIKRSICPSACRATVRRGNLCRGSSVTRDNCGNRNAVNNSNKISHIRVLLGPQRVHLFWNGTPRTDLGTNEEFGCHPNARLTPRGWDTVGRKCGENHTSWSRYHMAWFTEFRNTEMSIGFHNSQPLSGGPSHGCVRVSCEDANKINQNSVSNWTSIMVR